MFRSLIFWRAVVCESVASFLYVLLVCLAEAMLANDATLPASSRWSLEYAHDHLVYFVTHIEVIPHCIAFIIIPIRQLHLGIVSGLGVAVLTSVFTPVSGGQVIILDISLLQVPQTLCFNERANMTTAFKIFPKLWHFSNYSPKFSALTSNMSRLHPFASHLSGEGIFPRCLG